MDSENTRSFILPLDYQNRFQAFYDMQSYKVNEILLVSTLYDDFILEEDGRLTEELTEEFSKLNLSQPPPRITRVSSGAEAIQKLEKKSFDLIITMRRLKDMDPFSFGRTVKKMHLGIPVVLLLTNQSDTISLPELDKQEGIDTIFTWNGDSDLFLAIVKLIEDMNNVDNDIKIGSVRVIIVVEDTIQYYSIFLPIIYKEILLQTQEIMEEGLNLSHRLLRRKGRPKILLAQTYEEATELYRKYKHNILGIITDVAFPLNSEKDFNAGQKLVEYIRQEKKYLPILIQSSDPQNSRLAESLNTRFVHKNSINYLRDFRKFMKTSMLFGDFVFRLPDGSEVARAKNIAHFEEVMRIVPSDSIVYHGSHNHFSNWLYSRGEYQLANELAPYEITEFDTIDEIRTFLITSFEKRRREKHKGVISEFSRDIFDFTTPFTRIGNGSLGGKGRGLAFLSAILTWGDLSKHYENVNITIPETIVITTDIFDQFVEQNDLYMLVSEEIDDETVMDQFLEAQLPEEIQKDLWKIIEASSTPLAVRSSSLLEDSQFHPLAGVYRTFMLSNDQDPKTRWKYLCDAIKLVYASVYCKEARSFITSLGQKIEIEKMAIVIQKTVGKLHNKHFYPDFSGVVKNYNYYPVSYLKAEDGIAEVAIGLGEMVVSGGQSLQFSPKHPKMLPQMSTIEASLENSQKEFYAIEMKPGNIDLKQGEYSTLRKLDISQAKDDGILKWLASTYDLQNNRIRHNTKGPGPIIISFPFILQYDKFPLAQILDELLEIGAKSLGYSVEVEFAVNLDYAMGVHSFYALQIRPLVINELDYEKDIEVPKENAIIYSDKTLGNGIFKDVSDIVYVDPKLFDNTKTLDIKEEISQINGELKKLGKQYILIGPGRWGTSDPFLGVPVRWHDIEAAALIIEASLQDFQIDPSQGMHFFLNLTSTRKGYFTIPWNDDEARIDWAWFDRQEENANFDYIRHLKTSKPLRIKINGKTGEGAVYIDGQGPES